MRVLVTGSGSCLAAALLPRLLAHPDIEQVVGLDLRPSGLAHAKFREHRLDVRDSELGTFMTGMDALIHLAFVVLPGQLGRQRKNRALMRDINVAGSRNVYTLAARHGVAHAVHLSSAAVYGAWPDNPPLLDEQAPLRPMPGFGYAEDKVEVERWLDGFEATAGAPRLVRLRPHVILGPHAQPLLRFLLRQPCYPRLPDPQPLTQCVAEEDVADAILAALFSDRRGAFNLAADPPMAFRDMQRRVHRLALPVPFGLARLVHRALWQVSAAGGEPAWLDGMRHSLAVDSGRAHRELGWRPRYSTGDCLARARKTAAGQGSTSWAK